MSSKTALLDLLTVDDCPNLLHWQNKRAAAVPDAHTRTRASRIHPIWSHSEFISRVCTHHRRVASSLSSRSAQSPVVAGYFFLVAPSPSSPTGYEPADAPLSRRSASSASIAVMVAQCRSIPRLHPSPPESPKTGYCTHVTSQNFGREYGLKHTQAAPSRPRAQPLFAASQQTDVKHLRVESTADSNRYITALANHCHITTLALFIFTLPTELHTYNRTPSQLPHGHTY
jgi:hypothetical protein